MTTPNSAPPPDCRCATCGTCYHDHGGFDHPYSSRLLTTPNRAGAVKRLGWGYESTEDAADWGTTHTGLERPILVDTEAASVYSGRKATVIYRWAGEGRLTRYGTKGKGNALWDIRELTHWAGANCGLEMPPPPPVKPQNFQDRA